MTSLLDSVVAEFSTTINLREPSRLLDVIRFIIGQGPAFEPWQWQAEHATRGRYRRFVERDLERLTADLLDPHTASVDFCQEPLGPYHLLIDWGVQHRDSQRWPRGRLLFSLPHEHFRGAMALEHVEHWLAVLKGIHERIGAYYGYAHETRDYDALATLRASASSRVRTGASVFAVYWANFFGPDLVQAIGREGLETVPSWRCEPLSGGGMLLVFSSNPLAPEASRDERNRLYQEWELERWTVPERPSPTAEPGQPSAAEPAVQSLQECRDYADLCVRLARELSHVQLDYSEASLARLDELVRGGWAVGASPEQVMVVMGCYLGETIIRELGGHWSWADPGVEMTQPHVQLGRQHLNVIGKVVKRFRYGESESLAWYFDVAKAQRDA